MTGHTGFKGSWLTLWLESLGADVTGYALDPPTSPALFDLAGIGGRIGDIRGDVRDFAALKNAISNSSPEVVFHLAAQPIVLRSYEEPKYTFDVNISGTVNLLEAARECKSVKAVVVITSDKCYRNEGWQHHYRETDPLGGRDPYSASKAAAEIVAESYRRSFFENVGIGLATARAGNVIGGGDWAHYRIVPDFIRAIESNTPLVVRNPEHSRPWQHVLEPLSGYLLLGASLLHGGEKASRACGAWNFAPPPESVRPVRSLVELFTSSYGSGTWKIVESGEAGREASMLGLSYDKAHHVLGWSPRWSFEEAVVRTADWYKKLRLGVSARELCLSDIEAFTSPGIAGSWNGNMKSD